MSKRDRDGDDKFHKDIDRLTDIQLRDLCIAVAETSPFRPPACPHKERYHVDMATVGDDRERWECVICGAPVDRGDDLKR